MAKIQINPREIPLSCEVEYTIDRLENKINETFGCKSMISCFEFKNNQYPTIKIDMFKNKHELNITLNQINPGEIINELEKIIQKDSK